jgi:hypothetical protein
MRNHKTAISLTLIGLFAANIAFALPEFQKEAPQSSIDSCVAEVDSFANLEDAKSVMRRKSAGYQATRCTSRRLSTVTVKSLFASTRQTAQ